MKFNYYIFIGFYIKYMTGGFMKILVVGGGARDHAIGEAILKNKKVNEIFFCSRACRYLQNWDKYKY